jgi:hypothetical protein
MDPATERLFFHTTLLNFFPPCYRRGLNMTWSDDQGEIWNHLLVAKEAFE